MDSIEIPFVEYSARIQHLESVYGIRVVTRDIPDPLTGDLDGAEIEIDFAVSPEQRLFLMAHLFGHTVEWNVKPALFEIGRRYQPPVNEDLIPAVMAYEREAACYGQAMLHEIGITNIDQWFCDYTACDQAYLLRFYRTGQKRDFRSLRAGNAPLIKPQPIPPFTPTRRVFRMDGFVIGTDSANPTSFVTTPSVRCSDGSDRRGQYRGISLAAGSCSCTPTLLPDSADRFRSGSRAG